MSGVCRDENAVAGLAVRGALLVALVAVAACGFAVRTAWNAEARAFAAEAPRPGPAVTLGPEVAPVWSWTSTEAMAWGGIAGQVKAIDAEIARIASGDQRVARAVVDIAFALRKSDADIRELEREAEKRLGVAVVASSTAPAWVRK